VDLPWTAVWDSVRPHVHPLRTLGGRSLSADGPADHPWHHGLWSTVKFVNGTNFWEEYGEFGTLRTTAVNRDGMARRAEIEWREPGSEVVALRETRTLTHIPIDDDAYAIEWVFALAAEAETTLDRTPFTTWGGYGGLTLRGAPDWVDTELRLPGLEPRDRVLGDAAPWCALRSPDATVALFDHPTNPRFPTPWYGSTRADTYGDGWANFVNAAFLWSAPLQLGAGEVFTRRHRVVVADGRLDPAWIEQHHLTWVGEDP
jgi:hypothetical protein